MENETFKIEDAERLARFVRPHTKDTARLLRAAGMRFCCGGYSELDKSGVREFVTALYSAAKRESLSPSALDCSCLIAACLEEVGLHPVLALGENAVGVGVWLHESCFFETVTSDRETVLKYVFAAGDLCFFDTDDLFAPAMSAFAISQRHFLEKLRSGIYRSFLDIHRCRLNGIAPLTVPPSEAPAYESGRKIRQWERRLLDLSARNALINFTGKNALQIDAEDVDELYETLAKREPFPLDAEDAEIKSRLMRRDREADEETGAHVLYLAFGFLHYRTKEGGKRLAPLVLVPVTLSRKREEFFLSCREREPAVNATLLEYLKVEFGLDICQAEEAPARKISELLDGVRDKVGLPDWEVTNEVYLATFSFQRFLMWNDLRCHKSEFQKNALVTALLSGRAQDLPCPLQKEEENVAHLLPLPSDSSQDRAVALSRTGTSFVLHGPPGTGKSQTIANIIACALGEGKRVLFVAEKRAALEVVKRRLEAAGVGEFCLQLNAGKTDKEETLRKIERTLALQEESASTGSAGELAALYQELKGADAALHRERQIGLSVYEAIVGYFKNRSAPDIVGVESAFYDGMTREKFETCKSMLASVAAAAKECASVIGAPFSGVNLTEYSQNVRDRVICAAKTLALEVRHVKEYLSLLTAFFRQKSVATKEALHALVEIVRRMMSGVYADYFSGADETEFALFFHANRRLDLHLDFYFKHFRSIVDVGDAEALRAHVISGGDWKLCRAAKSAVKALTRFALHPLSEEDYPKYLSTLSEIISESAFIKTSPRAAAFFERSGKINLKRRSEYLEALYELNALSKKAFEDFNQDAFHGACIRAASGCMAPVMKGFLDAFEAYRHAKESFLSAIDGSGEAGDLEGDLWTANALIDNADMLPALCDYRKKTAQIKDMGLTFVVSALESGQLSTENVLAGFEKNVYQNFLEYVIPSDPALARLTVGTLEETIEKFMAESEKCEKLARRQLRSFLISRLPHVGDEVARAETATFYRLSKSRRGAHLRGALAAIPNLVKAACPCMLMSPTAVAQYLQPTANEFDLVIFDEASQMSTAEAVGAIARAKAAVIVGDPKQLPPTTFFRSAYTSEDEGEPDDLESVLDDCLALGMAERHLKWHYRSRHESLIAFSNAAYYDGRLCTVPSPESESRVRLVRTSGVYDRGATKRNVQEAEALVGEIVRRLKDPVLRKQSVGVVTFSGAQQAYIEKLLSAEIAKQRLERIAYGGDEPVFVKNLENVQGDERDVILFSVGYGPDKNGKLTQGFGPLNQEGGWRRLNVAASRARTEMLVYVSFSPAAIRLGKTASRGLKGLKAFLEFAERGQSASLAHASPKSAGVGKFIAEELSRHGYECRCNVGASDFKLDVAVLDPRDKTRFLLGIVTDGKSEFSVKDRHFFESKELVRAGWELLRVESVNYFGNPAREIGRIKGVLDRLTGATRSADDFIVRYARPYRALKALHAETPAFIMGGEHDGEICARIQKIVSREEPISAAFLKKRVLNSYGIEQSGELDGKLSRLLAASGLFKERVMGVDYYFRHASALKLDRFRTEHGASLCRSGEDLTVFEILSLTKGALEDRVALYMDELVALIGGIYPTAARSERFHGFVRDCVRYGEEKGLFVRSVSDRVSLA